MLTSFEGDLHSDLCALSPVLMEHSTSNAENFVLIKSQRKKIEETTLTYDYGYEAL